MLSNGMVKWHVHVKKREYMTQCLRSRKKNWSYYLCDIFFGVIDLKCGEPCYYEQKNTQDTDNYIVKRSKSILWYFYHS